MDSFVYFLVILTCGQIAQIQTHNAQTPHMIKKLQIFQAEIQTSYLAFEDKIDQVTSNIQIRTTKMLKDFSPPANLTENDTHLKKIIDESPLDVMNLQHCVVQEYQTIGVLVQKGIIKMQDCAAGIQTPEITQDVEFVKRAKEWLLEMISKEEDACRNGSCSTNEYKEIETETQGLLQTMTHMKARAQAIGDQVVDDLAQCLVDLAADLTPKTIQAINDFKNCVQKSKPKPLPKEIVNEREKDF